jgi:hypothetical protein
VLLSLAVVDLFTLSTMWHRIIAVSQNSWSENLEYAFLDFLEYSRGVSKQQTKPGLAPQRESKAGLDKLSQM